MRGSSIRLSLTLLTFLFTPKAFAAWVLPPHAASAVKVAVKVASKADKDGLVRSAALNKDTISVKAENSAGETVLAVTLVHPSVAPEGSFLGAGVALLTSPGPLDASALAGLKASLKAAKRAVPWVETPDDPNDTDDQAEANAASALDRAAQRLRSGVDRAQVRSALEALPTPLPPALALRLAVLWTKLGDPGQAQVALKGISKRTHPVQSAAGEIIRGAPAKPAALLGKAQGDAACAYLDIVDALSTLDRSEEALALAEEVLARAPDCPAAYESMIHRRLETQDNAEALALAERASERFATKESPAALLATLGTVYLSQGMDAKATPLLEAAAMRDPQNETNLRLLMSATLRDPKARSKHVKRLETLHAESPDNPVLSLLLGVLYHYANRFEDSDALLRPLEATLGQQSRLQTYLALNEFNQDKPDAALKRLEPLTKRSNPDPFVFYCRAEFLRDTKRDEARRDLVRYQTLVSQSGVSNTAHSERIAALLKALDTCIEEQPRRCPGLWENPRIRTESAPSLAAAEQAARQRSGDPIDSNGVRWDKPVHTIDMVIDVATTPEDYGGNLFLVGYRELDIGAQPVDHIDIAHYHQLAMWLQRFPFRAKVELVEGIHYRAVYSHNDFPLVGDAVSTFFQIGASPPSTVSVVVNRYGHERNDGTAGATPVLEWKASADTGPQTANVVIYLEPPPEKKSGKVFVAGFKDLDPDTKMPVPGQLPSDYHTVKGVDKGLPLRLQLPLVKGLHYMAIYGFGMFPGGGDRVSRTTTYQGEPTILFTIEEFEMPKEGASAPPGSAPSGPTSSEQASDEAAPDQALGRTWIALLLGLLAVALVIWLARRRR